MWLILLLLFMLTDERTVSVAMNNSNYLTVDCGDVDSHCILNYESNKTLNSVIFEPNTTMDISLEENNYSLRLLEISTFCSLFEP